MSYVATFIPFLVVRNSIFFCIEGFNSPWNFNKLIEAVTMMDGGLPTAFGTGVVCCWVRALTLLHLWLWRPNQPQPSLGVQSSCGSGSLTCVPPLASLTSWTSLAFWHKGGPLLPRSQSFSIFVDTWILPHQRNNHISNHQFLTAFPH